MDNSLKTLSDIFELASQFFEEASELVTGYARREQILRKDPQTRPESKEKPKSEAKEHPEKKPKTEKKEKQNDEIEKPNKKSEKPKPEKTKKKSGYQLYLETKVKDLKNDPGLKKLKANEYSQLISSLWDSLSSSEKEIWSENASKLQESSQVVEIIPQKHQRSENNKSRSKEGQNDQNNSDEDPSSKKRKPS